MRVCLPPFHSRKSIGQNPSIDAGMTWLSGGAVLVGCLTQEIGDES